MKLDHASKELKAGACTGKHSMLELLLLLLLLLPLPFVWVLL